MTVSLRLAPEPRVLTIPPGAPFLPTLAEGLLSGTLIGPLSRSDLADATIYLPTRRACRAFARTLLARGRGRGLVLPRIVPLGDAEDEAAPVGSSPLPPAIPPLERRLILTRLVQAWADGLSRAEFDLASEVPFTIPGSPADAVSLAGDLEALMDSLATENVDWSALEAVVDTEYSRYFRLTLDFVRIAHRSWPGILAERGALDPAVRSNAVIGAEAARLLANPPAGPVIAAGSTGSIPATAGLLAAVARLPRGAVVLPGLDLDLDEASWDAIGGRDCTEGGLHGHPQFMLHRLLGEHLEVPRRAVGVLGVPAGGAGEARARLVSEIMRPADTTDAWAALPDASRLDLARRGSAGLALIEAADEREEALAIAVALRETLASPEHKAALVTPDRALARRVAAELGRWNVPAEDSAGLPLADAPIGRLARLAAEAAALDFGPLPVLALLAHPLAALGLPRAVVEQGAAALELGVLRGPAPRAGLSGLRAAFALRRDAPDPWRQPRPVRMLSAEDWALAADLLDRLERAFEGFRRPDAQSGSMDLVALASRHAEAVARLTATAEEEQRDPDRAEDALAAMFDDLSLAEVDDGWGRALRGGFSDYPAFFAALARTRSLAPDPATGGGRVQILGLLEARLIDVDRVVLGGLDETVWPPVAETDAFLNRPMRVKLGLTPPERRIGQTAHDFAQALGVPDAVLTRARKREGKPTVPSRFLQRLRAFAGGEVWGDLVRRGDRYRDLAARLDQPRPVAPLRRPAPRPGPERFPRRLSVTEIETLVRDPYSIFARHVLRLEPLDWIGVQPSAAERGTILHDVVGSFAEDFPGALPPQAEELLLQRGADRFDEIAEAYPELHALWWPAFVRFVPAYLEWERERRASLTELHAERSGSLTIPIADGETFTLRGRADRIEFGPGGRATIIDFKSGSVPSHKVVAVGFSPQLTLEAAMLMRGGFERVPGAAELPQLDYVKIGGRDGIRSCPVKPPPGDTRSMGDIVAEHLAGLETLVRRYAVEGAGYLSRPYAQYARAYAPYDHLARVQEWSVTAGATEGGPEA